MLYQKLLIGEDTLFITVFDLEKFVIHRHPEIELGYCIKGQCDITIDNKKYTIHPGELAFVKPMAAHEFSNGKECKMLTIEIGPQLIGRFFDNFIHYDFDAIINRNTEELLNHKLLHLLNEIIYLHTNRTEFSELVLKGDIFHLSDLLLSHFAKTKSNNVHSKDIRDIAKVEKAIQIIYDEYPNHLTIEYVCDQCGYSKSNFCRVFKKITGETFYNLLNRHRVEIACMHLGESKAMIEDIAYQVGFADSKSFCRVFKKIMSISPGKYRKEVQNTNS